MPKSWEKINFVALFQCKEKRVLKRLMFCACTCVCVYEDNEGLERIYLMQVLLFQVPGLTVIQFSKMIFLKLTENIIFKNYFCEKE